MVAISLSGSGEGLGRVIARGYSTASTPPSTREKRCGVSDAGKALPLGYCISERVLRMIAHRGIVYGIAGDCVGRKRLVSGITDESVPESTIGMLRNPHT